MHNIRAVVFSDRPGERYRAGRTVRALLRSNVPVSEAAGPSPVQLAQALNAAAGSVWLIRAGCWPAAPGVIEFPSPSATRRALCAFGMVRSRSGSTDGHAHEWDALLAEAGGDFSLLRELAARLPFVYSMYLEAGPKAAL